MTIPIPTIDDFDTSTVMTTIREVVDYLIGMVPQINNGDITDLKTTYTNNVLTVTLVKGDGTSISKNVTIQASGGESPYPTDVALSLSGTILNFNMTMSNGIPINASVDLSSALPGGNEWEEIDLSNFPTDFSDGDWIAIKFNLNLALSSPSWNSAPTVDIIKNYSDFGKYLTSNVDVILQIRDHSIADANILMCSEISSNSVGFMQIDSIGGLSTFNDAGNLFNITGVGFNAGGITTKMFSINRTKAPEYIGRMWRKKA